MLQVALPILVTTYLVSHPGLGYLAMVLLKFLLGVTHLSPLHLSTSY